MENKTNCTALTRTVFGTAHLLARVSAALPATKRRRRICASPGAVPESKHTQRAWTPSRPFCPPTINWRSYFKCNRKQRYKFRYLLYVYCFIFDSIHSILVYTVIKINCPLTLLLKIPHLFDINIGHVEIFFILFAVNLPISQHVPLYPGGQEQPLLIGVPEF